MVAERALQKHHHDRHILTKPKPDGFHKGQWVALQDPSSKLWTLKGQITEEVAPRSFNVQMPGGKILRRNQRHLRKTYSTASSFQPEETDDTDTLVEEEEHSGGDSEATLSADSDATEPYDDREDDELFVLKQNVSHRGRMIKAKKPLDYDEL